MKTDSMSPIHFPSVDDRSHRESQIFGRLQLQLLRNRIADTWRSNRLRFIVVLVLSAVFWGIVFYLFVDGFRLLRMTIVHEATCAATVQAVFNVFFASLLAMIMVSSAIIFFSTAYRGRDVATLLTLPVEFRNVAQMKLREAMLFSGWGFFLLGSPMLWAYGLSVRAPWYYYLAVIPFMMVFVAIPVSLGCMACMLALRFMPRYRLQSAILVVGLLIAFMAFVGWSVVHEARSHRAFTVEWLEKMLTHLEFSKRPILPSWWLSSGLLEAAHPATHNRRIAWQESAGFFAVLASNALLLYHLAGLAARRWYIIGYSEMIEFTWPDAQFRPRALDYFLSIVSAPFPRSLRVLLTKDLRVFFRDVLQWSQFAVFAGLLTIYFLNIRRLQSGPQAVGWLVLVGFLNIGVVGLMWATFTTRFVYPLLSLEGRRFWVLGTSPLRRSTILWSKFLFATVLGLVPCCLLILLSDLMLGMDAVGQWLVILHQITSICMCLGLAGIAVGIGAWLPNLQETAPAKIATGYGGTLTLVLSVAYIAIIVMATAVPVWGWAHGSNAWTPPWMGHQWFKAFGTAFGLTVGILLTLGLGLISTCLPLAVGLRNFNRMEI